MKWVCSISCVKFLWSYLTKKGRKSTKEVNWRENFFIYYWWDFNLNKQSAAVRLLSEKNLVEYSYWSGQVSLQGWVSGLMFIRFITNVSYMLPIEYTSSLQITSDCGNICLKTSLSHSQFQFAPHSDRNEFRKTVELNNFISISAFQVSITEASPYINATVSQQTCLWQYFAAVRFFIH